MNCFWCNGGMEPLGDDDISAKFDQALLERDGPLFELAMNDLTHALYHKAGSRNPKKPQDRPLNDDDAKDVVLETIQRLWAWLKRQQENDHGGTGAQSA